MAGQDPQAPLLELRPPLSPTPHDHRFSRPRHIFFHHPAYEYQRLFDLPALDGNDVTGPEIHYATALLICGIVAVNA